MKRNLEFLAKLDKKLHFKKECSGTGYWSGIVYVDSYNKEKMSKNEVERVLEISKELKYILYPINTCCGFSIGYDFCKINLNKKPELLLKFKEEQLPKGYNFKKLSRVFMSKNNLAKAKFIGIKITNKQGDYEY